jgi:hypothetical protein
MTTTMTATTGAVSYPLIAIWSSNVSADDEDINDETSVDAADNALLKEDE